MTSEEIEDNHIYHYTKYHAVKLILKNKSLRFSDFRFLNDGKEIKYSLNCAINYCEDIKAEHHLDKVICNKSELLKNMAKQLLNNKVKLVQ